MQKSLDGYGLGPHDSEDSLCAHIYFKPQTLIKERS